MSITTCLHYVNLPVFFTIAQRNLNKSPMHIRRMNERQKGDNNKNNKTVNRKKIWWNVCKIACGHLLVSDFMSCLFVLFRRLLQTKRASILNQSYSANNAIKYILYTNCDVAHIHLQLSSERGRERKTIWIYLCAHLSHWYGRSQLNFVCMQCM